MKQRRRAENSKESSTIIIDSVSVALPWNYVRRRTFASRWKSTQRFESVQCVFGFRFASQNKIVSSCADVKYLLNFFLSAFPSSGLIHHAKTRASDDSSSLAWALRSFAKQLLMEIACYDRVAPRFAVNREVSSPRCTYVYARAHSRDCDSGLRDYPD